MLFNVPRLIDWFSCRSKKKKSKRTSRCQSFKTFYVRKFANVRSRLKCFSLARNYRRKNFVTFGPRSPKSSKNRSRSRSRDRRRNRRSASASSTTSSKRDKSVDAEKRRSPGRCFLSLARLGLEPEIFWFFAYLALPLSCSGSPQFGVFSCRIFSHSRKL
jgi:hypothetical protein